MATRMETGTPNTAVTMAKANITERNTRAILSAMARPEDSDLWPRGLASCDANGCGFIKSSLLNIDKCISNINID